jgi:putative ABC transport system permease protein
MEEQMDAFNQLFASIQKFLWFMGFSTLLSGIIGAGNIMYTTARERTREIGIRKAIGASISSIKQMFLLEAISLTTVSGLIGMIMGEGVLVLIGKVFIDDNSLIEKPTVDLPTGIAAIIILVISGTIIGLRPAVYASKLNAIDALREEN